MKFHGLDFEIIPVKIRDREVIFWDELGDDKPFQLIGSDHRGQLFSDSNDKSFYQLGCENRITDIFNHGLQKTLEVYERCPPGITLDMMCHMFVDFISFGPNFLGSNQDTVSHFQSWYDSLPFVTIQKFSLEALEWGDIFQILDDGKLKHSAFYLGNDRYLHKAGWAHKSIVVSSLKGVKEKYRCMEKHSYRLIRRKDKNNHHHELGFQQRYKCNQSV